MVLVIVAILRLVRRCNEHLLHRSGSGSAPRQPAERRPPYAAYAMRPILHTDCQKIRHPIGTKFLKILIVVGAANRCNYLLRNWLRSGYMRRSRKFASRNLVGHKRQPSFYISCHSGCRIEGPNALLDAFPNAVAVAQTQRSEMLQRSTSVLTAKSRVQARRSILKYQSGDIPLGINNQRILPSLS